MKVKCHECETEIEKEDKEYKRQMKKSNGTARFFCNLSCAASFRNKNLTEEQYQHNRVHLAKIGKVRRTVRSVKLFSYYLRTARSRKHTTNIDHAYLEELWSQQNGKCAISGISLIIHSDRRGMRVTALNRASLDRIDSTQGYNKGNVQFVATPLNYAKASYGDDEFKGFLMEVAHNLVARNEK